MGAQTCALRCVVPVQVRLIVRLLVNHSPLSACDNFLVRLQGHAFGAPGRDGPAALRAQAATITEASVIRRSDAAGQRLGSRGPAARGAAASPLPPGGSPPVAAAASRGRAPHPAAAGTGRTRPVTAPARAGRPSSSRQPSCRRAKITVKGARYARVLPRWRYAPPWTCDLPRQDLGAYQEDGASSSAASV